MNDFSTPPTRKIMKVVNGKYVGVPLEDEEDFTSMSKDFVTQDQMFSLASEWASVANIYSDKLNHLCPIILSNFEAPHVYRMKENAKKMKRALLSGIPEYEEIIEATKSYLHKRG
jgi:hypothetical protein